ncbi:hypothetical protein L3X38_000018 [Prunus dulcis]|uniref:Protein kinase domain-containing protein n=1 Tax=Prunus dulcis TaxID=3755 RepID=A0AAD4UPS4_PRUDU|nr:hypothetical protein L3X38_000018 [Prunus dulcis]
MDAEFELFNALKANYDANNKENVVKGAVLKQFRITLSASTSPNFNGDLYFEREKVPFGIRFLKVDNELKAKKFCMRTCLTSDGAILKAWFSKFIKQKEFPPNLFRLQGDLGLGDLDYTKGFWAIAYETFDFIFEDWLKTKSCRSSIRNQFGNLDPWWRSQLKAILSAVAYMHNQNILHGSLDSKSSYVVAPGRLKIINVGAVDFNELVTDQLKLDDLAGLESMFRDVLKQVDTWPELDSFLKAFNTSKLGATELIVKLINHPFLKDPEDRMKYVIDTYLDHHGSLSSLYGNEFSWALPWNSQTLPTWIEEIYDFDKKRTYDNTSLDHLVKFMRGIFNHFPRNYAIEMVEAEVRNLYPNVIDELHMII